MLKMRIKVLVSAYACNPLSSSRFHPGEDITGWRLVEQLSRFFDLYVISESYNKAAVEDFLRHQEIKGVKFFFLSLPLYLKWLYRFNFGKRVYYYLWQIWAWRLAVKLHRKIKFDVAHHLTFGNYWIPSFIGAFLSVPFIWGPLGGGQKVPKSFLREYTLGKRLEENFRQFAQWFGRNLLITSRRCLKNAKAILVCNYETKAKTPKIFHGKVHLFPVNGITGGELVSQGSSMEKKGEFLVLSAGRLDILKGFSIGMRAFSLFAKNCPDAILEIVGEGPEGPRLKRLALELGMGERVRFTPWLKREDLLLKMQSCQVFLFPSFRDGGGAVVVEAMASSKPVIGINIGGPGFHIHPEWGIKVEPYSPDYATQEIAAALDILYKDEALRLKMGEAAGKRAREFYLWEKLGDHLQEIYNIALAGD